MTMLIFTPYFQIFVQGSRLFSWNSTREEELLGNFNTMKLIHTYPIFYFF